MTDKKLISSCINQFSNGSLSANALALFSALGYQSALTFNVPTSIDKVFQFDSEKALKNEWLDAPFLFQLTESNLSNIQSLFTQVDGSIIESYMFVAIVLKKSDYSRTQLVTITRELNKKSPQPILILFKHGETLTLSVIHRRLHKRDESKDVLEKVTLLKDIRINDPHRAHIDILSDLAFDNLNLKAGASFVDLHNAWQTVLDTKTLNKQFYKELSQWYFWAMKETYFPDAENIEAVKGGVFEDPIKVREHNAKNLIRLLTRILFVWFIKEKNLIPEQLFNEDWITSQLKGFKPKKTDNPNATFQGNDSHFYQAILQNLFFATLNQICEKRQFRNDGQHRNVTNLMRYKSYLSEPDAFLKLVSDVVPFMNGGLFDCLDKEIKDSKGNNVIVYEDGFSDRADNKLRVPDYIFFGSNKNVDLSEELGNKQKSVEIRGLIDILKSYKFTITENTPIEEDIALDPELLGQVFENLLASYNPETKTTARKQTGSFYTPREIVDYMVDESLKAYFKSKLDHLTTEQLDDLLSYTKPTPQFSEEDKTALIEAIDTCKILDPACGSGAFPMGVLHKLVFVISKLDEHNDRWKARQLARVPNSLKEQVKEAFVDNEIDYARKLYLIENCIYGVDIQAIAIQISKLRFFISLIVDQKIDNQKPNFGVLPLPNLETKFVAANTLIDIEKPKKQTSLFDSKEIEALEEKLKKVRHSLFSVRSPSRKRELREEDKLLREQIGELLEQHGWGNETAQQLAHWNPYDQNANAEFFNLEWMFGETGFDIVIGNPPYVQVKKGIFSASQFPYSEGKDKGKQNLYKVFTEQSFNLLKDGGFASLIVQSSLMADVSAQYTRELLLTKTKISFVIEFPKKSSNAGGQVFENVLQGTCVYLFKKEQPNEQTSFKVSIDNDVTTINSLIFDDLIQYELIKIYPNGFFIPLVKPKEFSLAQKVFNKSKPFSAFITGSKKGDLSSDTDKKLFFEKTDGFKLIRGNNVQRYFCKSDFDFVEINDKTKLMQKKNSEQSIIAFQNITGTVDLHRIHSCLFEKQNDLIFLDTTIKVYVKENINSKFLLACVNSSLMDWYFRKTSTNNHVNGYEIEALPIPKISEFEQQAFIKLVDYVLFIKKQPFYTSTDLNFSEERLMSNFFENLIDALVYELYFPEELHEAKKQFMSLVIQENFPDLNAIEGDKVGTLKQIVRRLTDKNHPLYNNLFFLDNVPVVRIIEGKA